MSLVDVVVGVALLLVLFLALFGVLKASLLVSSFAKAKADATAIAQTEMEYLRGLSYDAVGTVGGIPPGAAVQDATTTENGITYTTHVFVSYVDDPADGTGSQDTNGITTDYKRGRVSVSYTIGGQTRDVALVSNFAPPGIETTNGGGTLAIHTVDATGAALPNAMVRIVNASTSPTVDVTTFSNIDGQVYLPGAATSSDYQVYTSKSGYSSAQTYARDATNENPNPGYLTVAKDQTTTGTFAIDRLATLSLSTFSPIATSTFSDTFTGTTGLAAMSSTTVSGGALTLSSGETSGSARSVATTSAYLTRWGQVMATTTVPSGASVAIHIYDQNGTLIPDTVLPGNAVGFTSFPVSLGAIATTTYPFLALGADLSTTGSAPQITDWSLSYAEGPIPLPNVAFTLTGAKTIGTTGGGSPIYKTTVTGTTGSSGVTQNLSLEWDNYALSVPNYDIVDACTSPPYALEPGSTNSKSLILGSPTSNSLRVLVTDNNGVVQSGARVTISHGSFSKTVTSSSCGSAYVGGLTAADTYSVSIAKTGYTTSTFSNVSVSGASLYSASFP